MSDVTFSKPLRHLRAVALGVSPHTGEGTAVMSKSSLAVAFAVLVGWSALGWSGGTAAADLSKPIILVAKPELHDEMYGSTIIVVAPVGGDQHVGFIVNRA